MSAGYGFDSLGEQIHATACARGFYDHDPSVGEKLALIHSEVSEALEAARDGDMAGEAEELADILIRVLDYAAWRGMSMDRAVSAKVEKNESRPRLHGRRF